MLDTGHKITDLTKYYIPRVTVSVGIGTPPPHTHSRKRLWGGGGVPIWSTGRKLSRYLLCMLCDWPFYAGTWYRIIREGLPMAWCEGLIHFLSHHGWNVLQAAPGKVFTSYFTNSWSFFFKVKVINLLGQGLYQVQKSLNFTVFI